jgi:hypothetical protein
VFWTTPKATLLRERSATTTTIDRKSYTHRKASEREGKQDYLKILLIGEEMVEL